MVTRCDVKLSVLTLSKKDSRERERGIGSVHDWAIATRLYPAMRQGGGCLTAMDQNMKYSYVSTVKMSSCPAHRISSKRARPEFLHTGCHADSSLTRCEAVSTGKPSQTFRRIAVPPSSGSSSSSHCSCVVKTRWELDSFASIRGGAVSRGTALQAGRPRVRFSMR
jgi:hypothetical protein